MILYLALFFILGTAVGSFLNVVIDRTAKGESIVFGRSYCDHCHATLATFDLIPILSFVGLGARCRYCRHRLSWQYPLVETLVGIVFCLSFYSLLLAGNFSFLNLFYYLIVICTLVVVAVVDLKFSLIPTGFVFASSLLVLFRNFFYLSSQEFVSSALSAFFLAFSFLGIVLITRGKGMGSGDVPLVFLLGLFLEWPYNIAAIFGAFLSGAIVSVILLVLRKKTFGQAIPFGPFLIGSALVVLFWGKDIISWYLNFL